MFEVIMGVPEIPQGYEINKRTAVRAALRYGDRILMVKTSRGDYKFPGGGVQDGEALEEALLREIAEETGYVRVKLGDKLGKVLQQRLDYKDQSKYFVMESFYYTGELSDLTNIGLNLDDYEDELDFHGEFVSIQEALDKNKRLFQEIPQDRNDWLEREIIVLEHILNQVR